MFRLLAAMGLSLGFLLAGPSSDSALRAEITKAMRKAAEYFRSHVAVEGSYLWRYSEDLSVREGEGKASASMAWVQPPGTPSVGMVFLDAYRATRDSYYLAAARETAQALVRGQLQSGGWDYSIEFDALLRPRYAYRSDGNAAGRNVTTLDDDTTQSALRFLMLVDEALQFKDEKIHGAALYALQSLLAAQYPNGAWPQRYERPPDAAQFPVKQASYPQSWSRTHPATDYRGHYTFNDNTIADTIETMFLAHRIYRDPVYKKSAERAGEFVLLAQMPEPQPAWAQQYDANMHPAWARRFEPPAVTGGESQGIMRTLLMLYRETGDAKYLDPLPRTIAFLKRSRLPDGRLARFYELETNRPLYFTKDYKLTYSDADMPTHYSFKVLDKIDEIAAEYEQLRKSGPQRLKKPATRPGVAEVRPVLDTLDEKGRWLQQGQLRTDSDSSLRRVLDTRTFNENMRVLIRFLDVSRHTVPRP